ncbi:MAG TPA: peptidase M20, partial [Acidimicrobiales bacterium]
MDLTAATATVERIWEDSAVAALTDYIRIPAKSPAYDADWVAHGHLAEAVELIATWCRSRELPGATVEIRELAGRTPVVLVEVPARGEGDPDDTVLLYGHLDKQPEFTGWRDGLGPWTPVLDGDRLYGRGGADDGYSA